jgi:hypothetical protein
MQSKFCMNPLEQLYTMDLIQSICVVLLCGEFQEIKTWSIYLQKIPTRENLQNWHTSVHHTQ